MTTLRILIALTAPLALLSACSDEGGADRSGDEIGDASGEVLGGDISDAMLPVGRLRSESPIDSDPSDDGASQQDDAESETGEGEAEDAPAQTAPSTPAPPAVAPPLSVAPPLDDEE